MPGTLSPSLRRPFPTRGLAAALLVALAVPAAAQQKPLVTPADYGKFESLGFGQALSPNGRWLAYPVTRVNEQNELRIRPLDRDTTLVAAFGTAPRFSANSQWLAWTVNVSPEERARLERDRRPIRTSAAVMALATGERRTYDAVRAMAFDATGQYLALHGYTPESPAGKGADLRIVHLATGTVMSIGNVGEFAWSDRGSLLAMAIATGTTSGNAVQVHDAATGRLRALDASGATYRALAWRRDAADLVALRSEADAGRPGTRHRLLAWRGVDLATPAALALDPRAAGIADTLEVVEHSAPRWSDDGTRIAFGLRPVAPRPDSAARRSGADSSARQAPAEEASSVQIWHTADVTTIPGQKSRAAADARRTLLAVWTHGPNRVTQVGTELSEQSVLTRDWRFGIERSATAHPWGAMYGRPYVDVRVVDIQTGARRVARERVRQPMESTAGRYLLWFDGKDWWTQDLQSGAERNITANLGATFTNTQYDTPTDQMPAWGQGGWMKDDAAVLLFDRYDVWRVAPDGSRGERLTRGAEDRIIHRPIQLDRQAVGYDPAAPMYFSLRGELTQNTGYARLRAGRPVERLIYEPRGLGGLVRADSAATYAFVAQARDDAPDIFITNADLAAPRQVTRLNPFQADYAWTRAELVDFTSEAGLPLQGVLLYPANHDPSRRYPMIVYTYEILTTQMHQYQVPSERSYYNYTAWTQHGYFVLMPDIVFRAREPGVSTIEAVRPAIAAVAAKGLIDPAKVGHIGHSWGGYEAAYMPTRTNMFAASVAGAALTDFISVMGQFHWNGGMPETSHWETGQARMEVPYWEDREAHLRNSPIEKVHEMQTPLLMAHGDKDGVVEYFQATTFYNFARRAGRNMVLLVYEGEDHGFQRKANQIDYHRRILEWFGHYLKGDPAPDWITKGVRLGDHDAEKKRVATKP